MTQAKCKQFLIVIWTKFKRTAAGPLPEDWAMLNSSSPVIEVVQNVVRKSTPNCFHRQQLGAGCDDVGATSKEFHTCRPWTWTQRCQVLQMKDFFERQ